MKTFICIPDLKNFDGHGGRAKSEIMVTSTEQHITGRKTFFDISVLKPDNNDQAANKNMSMMRLKKYHHLICLHI